MPANTATRYITVQSGDTEWSLASQSGYEPDAAIAWMDKHGASDKLVPGEQVEIPVRR